MVQFPQRDLCGGVRGEPGALGTRELQLGDPHVPKYLHTHHSSREALFVFVCLMCFFWYAWFHMIEVELFIYRVQKNII